MAGRLVPIYPPTEAAPTETFRNRDVKLDVYAFSGAPIPFWLSSIQSGELGLDNSGMEMQDALRGLSVPPEQRYPQIVPGVSSLSADVQPYTDNPPPDYY